MQDSLMRIPLKPLKSPLIAAVLALSPVTLTLSPDVQVGHCSCRIKCYFHDLELPTGHR